MARLTGERAKMLRSIPAFAGMSDKELARIDGLVDDSRAEAGEVLVKEGEPGRETFVIVEGEAIITIGGREVQRVGPGELFGELALLDFGPRAATVTANTPMRLLVVGAADFIQFIEQPGVAVHMLKALAERLRG